MGSKSEFEKRIEAVLTDALEKDMSEDEISLLEKKVKTIRSLAEGS